MRILPLLAFLLAACPSSDDTGKDDGDDTADTADEVVDNVAECDTTTPCGGDAVGTWTLADVCMVGSMPVPDECPEAVITVQDLSMTGTLTMGADGTYDVSMGGMSMELLLHLPDTCTQGLDCATLGQYMESDCVDGAPDGCDCTLTNQGDPSTDAGAYVVSGTTVTLTSDDGSEPETADFCADIDELWVSMPPEEAGSPSISLVFTK